MAEKILNRNVQTADILQEEYNVAPYPSFPFSQTHPTHLFTLGTVFGLKPKPVEKARVLELGCAGGGNLIPMAYHFPTAEFVGIDLAEKQIEEGAAKISALGIKNLDLRHQSVLDFNRSEGKFDYIICHGVYSWVNDVVRDKILQICNENLNKNGIAYVSYNTLPGWNMVNSFKDLMFWHTKNITDPKLKTQQARSILKFMADGLQPDKSPYAEFLRGEINLLTRQTDSYLLHEHLSSFNHPFYFHQFMEQANKHQLSYLSDAYLSTMYTDNLPQQFAKELGKVSDIVVVGQYMDFIRNQRFRCTLLCHQDNKINRSLKTTDIEQFYLQLACAPSNPNFSEKEVNSAEDICFVNGNITLKVSNPVSKMAMLILFEEQHKPIHYNELCQKLSERASVKDMAIVKQHLNEDLNIMRSVFAGLIYISSYPGDYSLEKVEKPYACPLARQQALTQNSVTNGRHQNIGLDPLTKIILPLLDGTHDLDMIVDFVLNHIENGVLSVRDEKQQIITNKEEILLRTRIICRGSLENMAKQALFVSKE